MVLTESNMLPLGTSAPDFSLPQPNGRIVKKSDFEGRPLLVMFICNHCPYVKHVAPELARIGNDYSSKQLAIVAIQSNDVESYPEDSPEKMQQEVIDRGYSFPYVYDQSQEVAKAYTATCTPDFFLFDANHHLVYRGQLDSTRPKRIASGVYDSTGNEPDGHDLRSAIDAVLNGTTPSDQQFPSMGCNIKWISNSE